MTMNLRDYADVVTAHAAKLQNYLDDQDEKLGFEVDVRAARHFPQDLEESRIALMSACADMSDLVDGAESGMTKLPFFAVHDIGALKILYHYKLWDLVPEQGVISYADLARSTRMEVSRLSAYVRHLITRRVFREPKPGMVAHSTASRFIAQKECLQCWIGMCTDDILEAVQAYPETYDTYGLSLDPKRSPFNIARKDESLGGMALVLSDKERGPRYSKGVGWLAQVEMGSNEAILDAYSFDDCKLIVDVGGGDGNFSLSLARKYPQIRCIIQDIAAQASYFQVPEDLASRLKYQVHDFFTPQPVHAADVYVLKIVLHCFADDEKGAAILRNILPAMKETSRILLIDAKLDPQAPVSWARMQTSINSSMQALGGKDRTAEDWARVIQMASSDLALGRIFTPPNKFWSAIEVVRKKHGSVK